MSFIPPIVCLPEMSTVGEFHDPESFCQGEEKRKDSEENTSTFSLCLPPPQKKSLQEEERKKIWSVEKKGNKK